MVEVPGRQGHVAYPHLADNPITRLVAMLAEIDTLVLDRGNAWFQPSNIEVTDLRVGNPAANVIPASAAARLSIRFNDEQRGETLVERLRAIAERHAPGARVTGRISGEAFLTEPGPFSTLLGDAIRERTGLTPDLSTTGGHVGRALPVGLVPDGRVRAGQRNHASGRRGGGGGDLGALADIYAGVLGRLSTM